MFQFQPAVLITAKMQIVIQQFNLKDYSNNTVKYTVVMVSIVRYLSKKIMELFYAYHLKQSNEASISKIFIFLWKD